MTYEEAIEKMAAANNAWLWCDNSQKIVPSEAELAALRERETKKARAAAEAIGLREMMEAHRTASDAYSRGYQVGYASATNDYGITQP